MVNRIFAKMPLALVLILTLAVLGCNEEKKSPGLAVVDAEVVFQKSKLAAAGMQHIESMNSEMQKRLGEMQKELTDAPDNTELEQKLQRELFGLQTEMDAAQRAVAEKINALFDQAVEDYRKAHGFEAVLPKQLVMAVREGADITDQVVEVMDKNTADFSNIKLIQPERDAAASGAAGETTAPADGAEQPADAAPAETPADGAEQPAETPSQD